MNIFKSISLESYLYEFCFTCAYLYKMDENSMKVKIFVPMKREKQTFMYFRQ